MDKNSFDQDPESKQDQASESPGTTISNNPTKKPKLLSFQLPISMSDKG